MTRLIIPSDAVPGVYVITVTADDGSSTTDAVFTLTIQGKEQAASIQPVYQLKIPETVWIQPIRDLTTIVVPILQQQPFIQTVVDLSDGSIPPGNSPTTGGGLICWSTMTRDQWLNLTRDEWVGLASADCVGSDQVCWSSMTRDQWLSISREQWISLASADCVGGSISWATITRSQWLSITREQWLSIN